MARERFTQKALVYKRNGLWFIESFQEKLGHLSCEEQRPFSILTKTSKMDTQTLNSKV